jgi:hypothetical protein
MLIASQRVAVKNVPVVTRTDTFRPGVGIDIEVTVTNKSAMPAKFACGRVGAEAVGVVFEAVTDSGANAEKTTHYRDLTEPDRVVVMNGPPFCVIEPGQSIELHYDLRGLFKLAVGKYRVRAKTKDLSAGIWVESNEITVSIVQ